MRRRKEINCLEKRMDIGFAADFPGERK